MWVVIVDGNCYGFFGTHTACDIFVRTDFPVAFAQKNFRAYEFISV